MMLIQMMFHLDDGDSDDDHFPRRDSFLQGLAWCCHTEPKVQHTLKATHTKLRQSQA